MLKGKSSMEEPLADRNIFYHDLNRKITVLILMVSFLPMMLTTGIFFYRFNLAYTEKDPCCQHHGQE
jgi:two-component system NtrC family sensor kinase